MSCLYTYRGLSSNSAGMCLDKSTGRILDLGKVSILDHFLKIGLPSAAIYGVCQSIETRKTAKRKAESGRGAVKMP